MMYAAEGIFLKELFNRFNSLGIQYAVIRNYETLPESTSGSDVDIWVHPDHEGRARLAIGEAVKASGGAVIGCANQVGFTKISVFGLKDSEQSSWWGVEVDLFWGMYFCGAAELLSNDLFVTRCRFHNGIRVLPNDLAAVLGVVKELLHNDILPPRYLRGAREAVKRNWTELRYDLAPMGEKALSLLGELCLAPPDRTDIAAKSAAIRRAVLRAQLLRAPLPYFLRRFLHQWSKVRRMITPPGMIVAVLGTDGAGKSTIISAIEPVLSAATHGTFTVKHLRPGLLPPLACLKGMQADQTGPVSNPHGSKASGGLGSMLRVFYLITDYLLGYWLVIRPKIAKEPTIVLFDRYAYDMVFDPRRFRIGLPSRFLLWVTRFVPKPDLILCLYGDPIVIAARKRELPKIEIARQIDALKKFAKQERRAVLVSTEGPVEEVCQKVLFTLREFCFERNR